MTRLIKCHCLFKCTTNTTIISCYSSKNSPPWGFIRVSSFYDQIHVNVGVSLSSLSLVLYKSKNHRQDLQLSIYVLPLLVTCSFNQFP